MNENLKKLQKLLDDEFKGWQLELLENEGQLSIRVNVTAPIKFINKKLIKEAMIKEHLKIIQSLLDS